MSISDDGSDRLGPTRTLNIERILTYAGLIFSFAFLLCVAYFLASLVLSRPIDPAGSKGALEFIYKNYPREILVLLLGLVSALIALNIFSKIGNLQNQIIRREDRALLEPLIADARCEGIDQYIRLSALSGFSGTFVKLGFTGLPLATIALTVGLILMAVVVTDPDRAKEIMELGKLTLGAFIGSFVQRNIEQQRSVSGAGGELAKVPRSERLLP